MIKGKEVILRPIYQEDFPLLHRWINDPEIMGFISCPASPTPALFMFTRKLALKKKASCAIMKNLKANGLTA